MQESNNPLIQPEDYFKGYIPAADFGKYFDDLKVHVNGLIDKLSLQNVEL